MQLMEYVMTDPAILAKYPKITNCAAGGPPVRDVTLTCVAPIVESE